MKLSIPVLPAGTLMPEYEIIRDKKYPAGRFAIVCKELPDLEFVRSHFADKYIAISETMKHWDDVRWSFTITNKDIEPLKASKVVRLLGEALRPTLSEDEFPD